MNKELKNIEIVCTVCEDQFVWTIGEQAFMNELADRGKIPSVQQPKRCAVCRKKKKEARARFENQ